MANVRHLYQSLIIEGAQNPHHNGVLQDKNSRQITVHNPTCGDQLILSGIIERSCLVAVAQQSEGCIISRASVSIMTDLVVGQPLDQIKELIAAFVQLLSGPAEVNENLLQQAIIFRGVSQFPMRVKCALLPWQALNQLIEGEYR